MPAPSTPPGAAVRRQLHSRRVLLGGEPHEFRICEATVEVLDDRIVDVHEGPLSKRTPRLGEVEELGEQLLTPAFVNMHTHLALCALRGAHVADAAAVNRVESLFFDFEGQLTPADIRAFAKVGAYESLLAGVGVVWDHYYAADAVADAAAEVGLGAVVAPTLQDLSGPGAGEGAAAEALALTVDIHRDPLQRARGVYAALGPHATDTVSAKAWGEVADLAQREGLPVHFHVAQSLEELERIAEREGCDPVTWLERLGVYERAPVTVAAHAIFSPLAPLRRLGPQHHLVVCPRAQAHFAMPARVEAWQGAGLSWLVGTDAAASNDAMDLRAELAWVAAQRSTGASHSAAMDALLAFEGSDANVAEALGAHAREAWSQRAERWGRFADVAEAPALLHRAWGKAGQLHPGFRAGVIEAGAVANLVAWELEHPNAWPAVAALEGLVHGGATATIANVMTRGQWRGEHGDFARSVVNSAECRAAMAEASARLAALA